MLAAIREENEGAMVIDRGSYLRVLVRLRCSVTRAAIEAHTQRPFALPSDFKMIMPSFKGRFEVSEDRASWSTAASHANEGARFATVRSQGEDVLTPLAPVDHRPRRHRSAQAPQ